MSEHHAATIHFRPTRDAAFAEGLIRSNMAPDYRRFMLEWDGEAFARQWPHLESHEILVAGHRVGLFCLSFDQDRAYLRELQVEARYRGHGIGGRALREAIAIAERRHCRWLRLRVFKASPARRLYERHGFAVVREEAMHLGLQRELNPSLTEAPP